MIHDPLEKAAYRVIFDPPDWDAFVQKHPDGHLLQMAAWGTFQSKFGHTAQIIAIYEGSQIKAGALVLFRPLPYGLGTRAYLPAGPLFAAEEAANAMLSAGLRKLCRTKRAIFAKAEPCDYYGPRPDLPQKLKAAGFQPSGQTIQPPRTVILDLAVDEEAILKAMNQSTRYKCKLGPKKEVSVRLGTSQDVASFNALMETTGERDDFGIRPPAYYQNAFDIFSTSGQCALLMASYAGQDLAGVMVFLCGSKAFYLYGASSNAERNRMPTYIVQWEAIRWAKKQGALQYDMWGIPDADEAQLEAEFENRRDGLWGVYGFKRGFGGAVRRSLGAWDLVLNPLLYQLYQRVLARRSH
jgi:peptidoglycan pentaglycine glycine transferase (the first glycine)